MHALRRRAVPYSTNGTLPNDHQSTSRLVPQARRGDHQRWAGSANAVFAQHSADFGWDERSLSNCFNRFERYYAYFDESLLD